MDERTNKKKDCTVHAVQLGGCQLGAVQLGSVLADKGKLGVTLLLLLLLLQLEVEGEEVDLEVDLEVHLEEEDGHSDPHRGQEAECDVPVPGIPGTGNFQFFWWYRNRYRNKLVPEKSLGTGIGKI